MNAACYTKPNHNRVRAAAATCVHQPNEAPAFILAVVIMYVLLCVFKANFFFSFTLRAVCSPKVMHFALAKCEGPSVNPSGADLNYSACVNKPGSYVR